MLRGPPAPSSSEHRFRALLDGAEDRAFIVFDTARRIVEWSSGATALFGRSESEMLGAGTEALFTPEDRAGGVPEREFEQALRDGRARHQRWHRRRDGSGFWGSSLLVPIRDSAGVATGFLKVLADRTETRRTGVALEQSENRLRAVFDTVAIGIVVAEAPSGRLVLANSACDRLFGPDWPRSARIADYADWDFRFADNSPVSRGAHPLARALAGEERPVLEALRPGEDGARHWVRVTGGAIRDDRGAITGAVAMIEDIDAARRTEETLLGTNARLVGEAVSAASDLRNSRLAFTGAEERRALAEEQVRQLQKMDALGQLTGGIAHDFNNMLAVVIGALELVQRRLRKNDPDIGRFVDAAMDGAQRAGSLTQRLMAFSRHQPLALASLDLNAMVQGMDDLLRRTIGEAIVLELRLFQDLWRVHADPSQLENALLNLAVNARDAMNGAGHLVVETGNVSITDAKNAEAITPGHYVLLQVMDTGCGMSPELAARVLDPFFTTKRAGAGTGLGLNQVLGAVTHSAGQLRIRSEPGRGTCVRLFLPRLDETTTAPAPIPVREAVSPGRADEMVLVVEDDRRVRELAALGLRELGYGVLEAGTAAEAMRLLDDHEQVALLFTDIVMPGMDGRALAIEARRRRPGLKVVFTSGDARNTGGQEALLVDGAALLPKPYGIALLSATVRAAFDR